MMSILSFITNCNVLLLFCIVIVQAWTPNKEARTWHPFCSLRTLTAVYKRQAHGSSCPLASVLYAKRQDSMQTTTVLHAFISDDDTLNDDPFQGISHLLDDGKGNIPSDLATSIWNWEEEHRRKDHLPKFEYSTRSGLRLVDEIAKNLLTPSSNTISNNNDRTATTYSDLIQEGVVALMWCMAKYDKEKQDESFEVFAKRHILSSLRKVLAHEQRAIPLPAHVLQLLTKARRKRQELRTKLGREPTMTQVADELNISLKELEFYTKFSSTLSVERTMEIYDPLVENTFTDQDAWQHKHGVDLEESSTLERVEEGEDEMWIHQETVAAPLKEQIVDTDEFDNPFDLLASKMIHDDVQDFLTKTLDDRQLQVIELRFGLETGGKGKSLEDTGIALGLSASRVAQLQEQAMEKLRTSYTNNQVETYVEDSSEGES